MDRISRWLAAGLAVLTALFCALNWTTLTAESVLNFVVMQVHAPMGVILLALMATFAVVLWLAALYARIAGRREAHVLERELRAARDLADRAESSRLEGLQHLVMAEFRMLNERLGRIEAARAARDAEALPLVKLP